MRTLRLALLCLGEIVAFVAALVALYLGVCFVGLASGLVSEATLFSLR